MATFNNRRMSNFPAPDSRTTFNHEGAVVHELNILEELFSRTLGTYLGEKTAYESDSVDAAYARVRELVANLPVEFAEYALKIAAIGRESNMISTPLAILTACFNDDKYRGKGFCDEHGVSKMGAYSDKIIRRGRDITDVLATQLAVYGRSAPIPKQERKCLKCKIESFDPYQLSKALGKSRAVSMADAIKMLRPSGNNDFYKAIIEGDVKFGNGKKQVQSELAALGAKEGKATVEDVKKSLADSSLMAIVKNLVAMSRAGAIDEKSSKIICAKLTNAELVRKSRMLPYQLYDAYRMLCRERRNQYTNMIIDALVEAIDFSVDNVEAIDGYTAFFVDLSGSMNAPVSKMSATNAKEVAALLAAIGAKKSNCRVFAFADRVQEVQISRHTTVVDATQNILRTNVGGCTFLGAALDTIAREGDRFDNVVILSDNDCYSYEGNTFIIDGSGWRRNAPQKSDDARISEYIAKGIFKRFFVNNLTSKNFCIINTDDYRKNLVTGFSERYIDEINGSILLAKNAGDITKLIDLLYDKYYGENGTSQFVKSKRNSSR